MDCSDESDSHWEEFQRMRRKGIGTHQPTIDSITALHERVLDWDRTFDGGCTFLLNWYRSNF
jgi:hypothetical protein